MRTIPKSYVWPRSQAPLELEYVYAGRACHLFSSDHDVMKIGPEFFEQKGNILHVVQPTILSTHIVYDIRPSIAVVSCLLPTLIENIPGSLCLHDFWCLLSEWGSLVRGYLCLHTITDTSFSSSWIRFLSEATVSLSMEEFKFPWEGLVREKSFFPSGSL